MMFRIALLVGLSALLHGATAKPYYRGKASENQLTEIVRSDEFHGKASLGMKEMEPWVDLMITNNDKDPKMAIWNAVKASKKQKYIMAEEDKDDLYHPLLVLEAHVDNHAARAVASDNAVPPGPRQSLRLYSHPEEDRDHLYHGKLPAFQPEPQVPVMQEKLESMIYSNPEEDQDHLYHK